MKGNHRNNGANPNVFDARQITTYENQNMMDRIQNMEKIIKTKYQSNRPQQTSLSTVQLVTDPEIAGILENCPQE